MFTMPLKPIILTSLIAAALMSGIHFIRSAETLVPEDGKVSATKLPFDQKNSKLKFETATFGMG